MIDRLPFPRGSRHGPAVRTVLRVSVPRPRPSDEHLMRVRRIRWSDDLLVVSAAGEIDLATAGRLERALRGSLPATTIIDLTEVTFLGVAGLRVIESSAARARTERRATGVVACTHPVLRLLHLFGVDAHIPLYRHLAAAVREVPKAVPARNP
ncbi:STAS domain-containing protein [Amycolatopsis regifaucium]|uniref:Two-component system response regulator n=1 Tax=Amycolatopsis regifaucium TaxID=546365 RepID=A0A154MXA7_9PSEU|nr:STAS domain-containing protein [Amycolatopsis regifaucium]KZB88650.1 two-component system response regulator [Amycolatopsis regifaucium]OKA07181.1 two-component system response regulator [Amycolatopsis regifaucium]SFI55036.1 anti-anti-sigma factor [Amycolatopsis regifaucium]